MGDALVKVGQTVPGHFALPFTRIPYNIAARGIDRTPLGLVGTLIDVVRTGGRYAGMDAEQAAAVKGWTGKGPGGLRPFGERLADNVIGSLVVLMAYQEALQNNITSEGPGDQNTRDQLWAQGWRPHSVRVGDYYIPLQFLGPWAIPLEAGAAIADAQTYHKGKVLAGDKDQGWLLDAARRAGSLVKNETYLRSIGDVLRGIQEPDRYGSNFVQGLAESLVPYGAALNNAATAGDPYARRADSGDIAGAVKERIPGPLHAQVPVAQDPLGRPLPNDRQGLAAFSPIAPSTIQDNQVLRVLGDHGVVVPQPAKTAATPNQELEVALTPDEQRQVQRMAGPLIEDYVLQTVGRSDFQQRSPDDQRRLLELAVSKARQAADVKFLQGLGMDQIRQRGVQSRPVRVPVPNSTSQSKPPLPHP
jgi:hypothetical protein